MGEEAYFRDKKLKNTWAYIQKAYNWGWRWGDLFSGFYSVQYLLNLHGQSLHDHMIS